MEAKFNNATPQRPEGSRPLDADLIPVDLQKSIDQLKNEQAYRNNRKNALTIFKSNQVTITIVALQQGESIHPGKNEDVAIMSLQVINGSLTFDNQKDSLVLTQQQLITLHQRLTFEAVANEESVCMITMVK